MRNAKKDTGCKIKRQDASLKDKFRVTGCELRNKMRNAKKDTGCELRLLRSFHSPEMTECSKHELI